MDSRIVALEFTLQIFSLNIHWSARIGSCSYLFTFCPPGPDERLKLISHRFLGIVLELNVASHFRARACSTSEDWPEALLCDDKPRLEYEFARTSRAR